MSESDESNMPPFIGLARPQSVNETMGHRSYYELQRRVADLEAECGALADPERLPCGHHHSLLLKSAETGEPLYCELCDCMSQRDDANEECGYRIKERDEARAEVERLKALLLDLDHVAETQGQDLCDAIDNEGFPYPSQGLADALNAVRSKP